MRRSDAESVNRLIREVISPLEYYNLRARREELAKYTAAELLTMQANDPDSVLIAWATRTVAGFCLSRYDDGVIWLSWFGVSEKFRGQGIGTALLEALTRTVRRRKCHKLWCDTRVTNKQSQKTLKKCGFIRIGKLENHWYGQDFYLWQKMAD